MQTLIEKLEVLLEAAKTEKPIQFRLSETGDWRDDTNSWKECLNDWAERRIKPTPKLRPWLLEEVPLEGWFREIDDNAYQISSVNPEGSEVLFNGEWRTMEGLLRHSKWTLTPFDANSWKPCGVEE